MAIVMRMHPASSAVGRLRGHVVIPGVLVGTGRMTTSASSMFPLEE